MDCIVELHSITKYGTLRERSLNGSYSDSGYIFNLKWLSEAEPRTEAYLGSRRNQRHRGQTRAIKPSPNLTAGFESRALVKAKRASRSVTMTG